MTAARRARRVTEEFEPDNPLDEAVMIDQQGVAGDLSEILDALKGFDQGSIKGILYRRPSGGIGKYEWIEEIGPPFDMGAIFTDLKERFQGGDFQLRIMAGGRIRKNVDFSIVKERNPLIAVEKKNDGDMMTFLQIMMTQQNAQQQAQQAAADRQMQMMMQMGQQQTAMLTAILPAMMGGREKTSELLSAFALMQPKPAESGNLLETITIMEKAKGLFGGDGGGATSETGTLIQEGLKLAGPAMGAIGDMIRSRSQGGAPAPVTAQLVPRETDTIAHMDEPALAAPIVAPSKYRVVDLIREDVLYCFARNKSPEFAADMAMDTIEAHGVTEEEIQTLVAAFSLSADWKNDLAAEGLDLRTRPEWADSFLGTLIQLYADAGREGDDIERGAGGATDAINDGHARPARVNGDGSQKPSGEPD